jgi:Flp pilus assembly protein TadG
MAALTFMRRLRSRARSEQGAEIIEFAMVTPIFALLIAAIFDFGFLFRNWELVTNAAREGARVGVLPSYSCNAGSPDITQRVQAYMAGSGVTNPLQYKVKMANQAVATGAGTFNACIVTVEMTQSLPSLSLFTSMFGSTMADIPVRAAAVMRTEAQAAP